jgi:hypothetical protein
LYGVKACSLASRKEYIVRVSVNTVLRRIFGHRRADGSLIWRKLYSEIDDSYFPRNIVGVMKTKDDHIG